MSKERPKPLVQLEAKMIMAYGGDKDSQAELQQMGITPEMTAETLKDLWTVEGDGGPKLVRKDV